MIAVVRSSTLILLGLVRLCLPAADPALLRIDFEQNALGEYTDQAIKSEWPGVRWTSFAGRATIAATTPGRPNKALKITYPAGSLGPMEGGGQFSAFLPPSQEMWLTYSVKFAKGFDFRLGGKLPGLASGGSAYTGGNIPKDGKGWSARYMWLSRNRLVLYVYDMDMTGKFGTNMPLNKVTIVPEQWYRLTQRIRLNTGNKANGVIEVWVNGLKTLSRGDIRWRADDKGLIDTMCFSTFHGGNLDTWRPTVTSYAYFDDFIISSKPPVDLLRTGNPKP